MWLSRQLIISTEQTSIYKSIFPNALVSKKAQNHEISICFPPNLIVAFNVTHLHSPEIQNALVVTNEGRYRGIKL